MDSFELNKIAGAVLFALLVSFGLSIASEMIFETEAPEAPGYMIAVAEPAEGHGEGGEAAPERPHIATLLASADPAAGEAAGKKCATCHTFGEGEANKVGPNLWNVVMRPIASHPGYEYSPALVAYAAEAQAWDYDHLDAFLFSPPTTVPKTKMAFAGLKNDAERANVIAYLRSLSASPAALPEAPAVEASAEATTATDAGTAAPAETAEAPAGAAVEGAEGAAPAAEQQGQGAEVAAQDPATNQAEQQAVGAEQAAAGAEQPASSTTAGAQTATAPQGGTAGAQTAGAEQAAETGQSGAAAGQQTAAAPAEGAAESGTNAQVNQPQGTLGPIDSTTADQQGAVQQVAPIEQPAPAPEVAQADPQQPDPPAEGAGQGVAQQEAPADAAPQQGAAGEPAAEAPAAGAAASGFAAQVAAADPAKGQNVARRCAACHTFEKDGGNRIGPLLWDVVNRPVASVPDFEYSEAMIAFSEGGQKRWTIDELDPYLADPMAHVPGTMMAFPGVKKNDERANLIAYLRTLSDNPAPLQ